MSVALSSDNQYRYWLRRFIPQPVRWNKLGVFIMLNPSTADDPTIRRCKGFAERFGWTEMHVVNLYALRATNPRELAKHRDPVGRENDRIISRVPRHAQVVAAWGAHPMARKREDRVIELLKRPILCLGKTRMGAPRHPLYLPRSAQLMPWANVDGVRIVTHG